MDLAEESLIPLSGPEFLPYSALWQSGDEAIPPDFNETDFSRLNTFSDGVINHQDILESMRVRRFFGEVSGAQ